MPAVANRSEGKEAYFNTSKKKQVSFNIFFFSDLQTITFSLVQVGWRSFVILYENEECLVRLQVKGDIVAAQVRSRMAIRYGRSNGSVHKVVACRAGGPGFDS